MIPVLCIAALALVRPTLAAGNPRPRRQTGFLCSGNVFATKLLTTVIEVNREGIKRAEPIDLGDSENLGLISLKRGRASNLHTLYILGEVDANCDSERWIRAVLPIAVKSIFLEFEWVLPGRMAKGPFMLSFEFVAANISLELPKLKDTGDKASLEGVKIFAAQGLRFGQPGVTTGLSGVLATLFTGLNLAAPNLVIDLLEALVSRLLQRYLLNSTLPI
ncbi:hypothetical protein IscW_ISCW009418 [Ixodes scapularis]|uniref:Secreted protein n=1 Tax=Ixodes scapularis TaxID=6945 RepID=B7PZB8_IXOSC|nr:hypothetical protein IscW_ISCW009418 [Ixodes scapularis]|eukprot:XP_002405090.1 hypothetical protein IscW_ISCW009418 [Ixodes scapularis]